MEKYDYSGGYFRNSGDKNWEEWQNSQTKGVGPSYIADIQRDNSGI